MGLTKSFAEILLQKLTIGNTRSILLNAVPGRLVSRLPLTDLDVVKRGLAKQFLNSLTTQKSFTFKFALELSDSPDERSKKTARTGKRLAAIKYDHDDYLKEHGIETFGFGFPILLRKNPRDASKYIAAPVFIFPLDIKQSFTKEREWIISRDAESEVRLNEVLSSYLENEEHMKMPVMTDEMLEDGLLDKEEIEQFCQNLVSLFDKSQHFSADWEELEDLPEKLATTDTFFVNNRIVWNGVFGLYKSQKQSQIKEMQTLIADFDDINADTESEVLWDSMHSPMITDPSQNGVLHSLNTDRHLVIQGPPGTGKSQTLTAVIAGALANNKKVLVVCEKRTALEVLKHNLEKLIPDLKQSIALVEDISKDRAAIVETVRNKTASYLVTRHQSASLGEDIKRFERKASFAEAQYRALRTPRKRWWSALVHQWMTQKKTEAELIHLFSFQKIFQEQELDQDRFFPLRASIEDGAEKFKKTGVKYAMLDAAMNMPKRIAAGYDKEIIFSLGELQRRLGILGKQLSGVKSKFVDKISNETNEAIAVCRKQLAELAEMKHRYGQRKVDILQPPAYAKVLAVILPGYKRMLADSLRAHELVAAVLQFADVYVNETNRQAIPDDYEQLLVNKGGEVVERRVREKLDQPVELMAQDGFDDSAYAQIAEELKALHMTADSFLKRSDYAAPGRVADAEREIVALLNDIKLVLDNESSLGVFVAWKSFEADLDDVARRWTDVLLNHDADSWKYILEQTWLYYQLISGERNEKFPTDDAALEVLKSLGAQIKEQQKEAVAVNLNNWFLAGQGKIKARGLQINQLFNLRGPKGGTRNSLRKIVHVDPDAFTDFFPVLMLNPGTCASLLPLKKASFDIVIFDEASQLRIEDTYAALLRGRQVIVSGDSQQMPPSSYFESAKQFVDDEGDDDEEDIDNEQLNVQMVNSASKEMALKESLLEFAIDVDYRQTYLDMHYRSRHPDLIQFSNVCFYNCRLVPMPGKTTEPPITYVAVNGLYENRTNDSEAREIVRILKYRIDGDMSVGVATFNLEQRNLILELIGNERAADADFHQKMNLFDKNDFFVKNLENIQGDERDVILISTTFGVKFDKTFRMSFGPISNKNGYRLLNVIITRAKHKLYVLTSIPELKINTYRERLNANRAVDGTTGLLAYLAYAKAVSAGNNAEKQEILDYIRSKISVGLGAIEGSYLDHTESPFEEEVYNWLVEYLGKDRVQLQYKCGGFRVDMVVLPRDPAAKMMAIECDGAAYHSDQLTWHHDLYRQQQLEEHGFVFHRIWSANWWRKPREEFQKLLDTVNSLG